MAIRGHRPATRLSRNPDRTPIPPCHASHFGKPAQCAVAALLGFGVRYEGNQGLSGTRLRARPVGDRGKPTCRAAPCAIARRLMQHRRPGGRKPTQREAEQRRGIPAPGPSASINAPLTSKSLSVLVLSGRRDIMGHAPSVAAPGVGQKGPRTRAANSLRSGRTCNNKAGPDHTARAGRTST